MLELPAVMVARGCNGDPVPITDPAPITNFISGNDADVVPTYDVVTFWKLHAGLEKEDYDRLEGT